MFAILREVIPEWDWAVFVAGFCVALLLVTLLVQLFPPCLR